MDLVVSRYGDSSCLGEETMRFCEELTAVRGVFCMRRVCWTDVGLRRVYILKCLCSCVWRLTVLEALSPMSSADGSVVRICVRMPFFCVAAVLAGFFMMALSLLLWIAIVVVWLAQV